MGESEISVRPGERRKSNALTVRISVVFAKWTFSDFAGAVPNLKPVEFGFPFLEKGFAFLDRPSSELTSRSSMLAICPSLMK